LEKKNIWLNYNEKELKTLEQVNKEYMAYLDAGKTEREVVKISAEMAEKAGYVNIEEIIKNKTKLKTGDKVYATRMNINL